MRENSLYIVARETGAEGAPLPAWASETENPLGLAEAYSGKNERVELPDVPGAFQLLNVFSRAECEAFIAATEAEGYTQDASVSLPRSVRHNENFVWIVDDTTHRIIWERCKNLMADPAGIFGGKQALGLNQRFRFYKYGPGDFFKPHTDGAWPGSRVVEGKLVQNAFRDRYSKMTFLVLLNDGFEGGATQFWVDRDDPTKPATEPDRATRVNVRTPAGGVLCFPHGFHPLHCLHASLPVTKGVKYIIRTDILFAR